MQKRRVVKRPKTRANTPKKIIKKKGHRETDKAELQAQKVDRFGK